MSFKTIAEFLAQTGPAAPTAAERHLIAHCQAGRTNAAYGQSGQGSGPLTALTEPGLCRKMRPTDPAHNLSMQSRRNSVTLTG